MCIANMEYRFSLPYIAMEIFFPSDKSFVCDWMFPFRWIIIVSLYCPFQIIVNDFCCNNFTIIYSIFNQRI